MSGGKKGGQKGKALEEEELEWGDDEGELGDETKGNGVWKVVRGRGLGGQSLSSR